MFSVQQTLLKPNVQGLDDDDNVPPAEEPTGLDYSSPWHDTFVSNKEEIRQNLHMLHPTMQVILNMCQLQLGTILLCDCSGYRYADLNEILIQSDTFKQIIYYLNLGEVIKYPS